MPARTLIKNATILTMDGELGDVWGGDLLIEDDRIAAVGHDLGVTDAKVLDGTDRVVIPGFVDSHRHTWQSAMRGIAADWTLTQYFTGILGALGPVYRPEDIYAGNLLGALEALDSGITTLLDWSHDMNTPEHADAAVEALLASGQRAVLAHGNNNEVWMDGNKVADWSDLERFRDRWFSSGEQRVTLALAPRGPCFSSMEAVTEDWGVARRLGLRITTHIGVGGFVDRTVGKLNDAGLMADDTTYIHCSRLDDDEFPMIADSGGTASVAAEVEMHMGHGFPPTGKLLAVGIRPSLSIDVCTGIGGDMFGAMRTTLAMQRAIANAEHLDAGTAPDRLDVTARDILEFATLQGARACGLDDKIGTLTAGKQADVVVLRADKLNMFPLNHPTAAVALAANPSNVETVFVAGEVVKADGELTADLTTVRRLAEESRDYLLDHAEGASIGGGWTPDTFVPTTS
jgi:5-methylthioadenosine/S-adenosylhomocysteine deaminase